MVAFEVTFIYRQTVATIWPRPGRFELDALVSAEISLDQIESGYQKLADPEVSRVVITGF